MTFQPRYEFGGIGLPLHLAVANGFPPETYSPMVAPLLSEYRVFSLPPRGYGPDLLPPPAEPGDWSDLATDFLAGWAAGGDTPLVAVGHSFGGVASLIAAVAEPKKVRALVLLDPTIMSREISAEIAEQRRQGATIRSELVEGALRRRRSFVSLDEAFDFFRARPLFKDWPDRTLQLYTAAMTRKTANRNTLELTWSPEWEAYYYRSFRATTWQEVDRLSPQIPLLLVAGETSTTLTSTTVRQLSAAWPRATVITIPGHGHLFPQELGPRVGLLIREWLGSHLTR